MLNTEWQWLDTTCAPWEPKLLALQILLHGCTSRMAKNTSMEELLVRVNIGLETSYLITNFVIIYMSIFHVKPSLCRTYALNHSIPSTVHAILSFAVDFADVTNIARGFFFGGENSFSQKQRWASFSLAVLLRYTSNAYRIFANIMVLLTYISYTHPFKYAKLVHKRNMNYIFLFGHFLTSLVCMLMLPRATIDVLFAHSLYVTKVDILTYLFYCEKAFSFVAFGTMAVLYVLSIRAILKHHKTQHSISKSRRRSQLVAVLVYCTPPNIFLALGLLHQSHLKAPQDPALHLQKPSPKPTRRRARLLYPSEHLPRVGTPTQLLHHHKELGTPPERRVQGRLLHLHVHPPLDLLRPLLLRVHLHAHRLPRLPPTRSSRFPIRPSVQVGSRSDTFDPRGGHAVYLFCLV
uniref:G protein-coupled receptor n=1 Tax=Steinernema glaseri TaxID=37863 RepID=A0A1I7YPT3_9BILA